MPHLTLAYSANLIVVDLARTLTACHDALAALGFDRGVCKSRAVRHDAFLVGDGAPQHAFVHVELAVLDDRTPAQQRAAGEALLAVLQRDFPSVGQDCQRTVEVRAMAAARYFKARG